MLTAMHGSGPDSADLAEAIRSGDRRALARGISLVESARADDRDRAEALLTALLPHRRADRLRIGLTGAPGVGKSTLIEVLGLDLLARGHRVAVLAVDPSSALSGGSILGDKTRMEGLARASGAFVRPSPAAGQLGGLARRTEEAAILAEAAGFDRLLIETVGVGQSETAVARMTDIFLLLVGPGGGDDTQGVKRGIMELADLVVVTKADGDLAATALRTEADYRSALSLATRGGDGPPGFPAALSVSALAGAGIADLQARVAALAAARQADGTLDRRRQAQAADWYRAELAAGMQALLGNLPGLSDRIDRMAGLVASGAALPPAAARTVLQGLVLAPVRDGGEDG
jgi:LAO/AO transport system kinase